MDFESLLDGIFDSLFNSSRGSGIAGAWSYGLGAYSSQLRGPIGFYAGTLLTSGVNMDDPSGLEFAGRLVAAAERDAYLSRAFEVSSVGLDGEGTEPLAKRPGDAGRAGDAGQGQDPPPNLTGPHADSPESRALEHLDRGEQDQLQNTTEKVAEVFVRGNRLGSPRDEIPKLSGQFDASGNWVPPRRGPENQIDPGVPLVKPPQRSKRPPPSSLLHRLPPLPPVPEQELPAAPEQSIVPEDVGDSMPERPRQSGPPVATDAAPPPETLLPWPPKGINPSSPIDFDRPENGFYPHSELLAASRIENHSAAGQGRDFMSRGGEGLLGAAVAIGAAVLILSNPVGWVAGMSGALLLAGGIATGAASAVQLGNSYAGNTTAQQDADASRAISEPLHLTSPFTVLTAVAGTVYSGDSEGFEQGAILGGLLEGGYGAVTSLPRILRAIPGLWRTTEPWMNSLALYPFWPFMGTVLGGGGRVRAGRAVIRVKGGFAARSRLSQIRDVEVLEKQRVVPGSDWADFQIYATGSRYERVVRITQKNGLQRIVRLDHFDPLEESIWEAKHGNMGQMFKLEREAFIIDQAQTHLDIADFKGWQGSIRYPVSTATGTERLIDRFSTEFPGPMSTGRLRVYWEPWTPKR